MKSGGDQAHISGPPGIPTDLDPDTPFITVFITGQKMDFLGADTCVTWHMGQIGVSGPGLWALSLLTDWAEILPAHQILLISSSSTPRVKGAQCPWGVCLVWYLRQPHGFPRCPPGEVWSPLSLCTGSCVKGGLELGSASRSPFSGTEQCWSSPVPSCI